MLKKNSVLKNIRIEDMNNLGYGICRENGIAVFVKGGVTGDICDIKIIKIAKTYCVAIIDRIISPSAHRKDCDCEVFKRCGGCMFCHITYEHELMLKRGFVESAMRKARVDIKVSDTLTAGVRYRSRNKAQYPISQGDDGRLYAGFYTRKSHEVIESDDCLLQPEIFSKITSRTLEILTESKVTAYDENTGKGLLRHIYLRRGAHSGETMLCLVLTEPRLPSSDLFIEKITTEFPEIKTVILNINPDVTNVILGGKYITLFGTGCITDTLCGQTFEISPQSFYQVNTDGAELLYNTAFDLCGLNENDVFLDLYCGIGTIGLSAAGRVKQVVGMEIVPEAVENAKKNALRNGIENASFFAGDAADASTVLAGENISPTVVCVDPPRKGCSPEVIEYISRLSPQKVLYISCDPNTLARDIKLFESHGYFTDRAIPVDMFPLTGHVESVTLLSKSTF